MVVQIVTNTAEGQPDILVGRLLCLQDSNVETILVIPRLKTEAITYYKRLVGIA
ncbi:hypothetical protein HK096_001971, partial [Nowakowskiella sp. JEL0078]